MDFSKMISKLEAIEDHAERLKSIENLLERLVETNQRQAQYLEHMWKMYEDAAKAAQNPSRMGQNSQF